MIKKRITYDDFDGNSVTEDHYFHLSKTELIEMELEIEGGLEAKLSLLTKARNAREIMILIKDIISRSYGQRDGQDARKFFKSKELTDAFTQSLAFDQLFIDVLMDVDQAIEFIIGLIPKSMLDEATVQQAIKDAKNVENVELPPALLPDPNGLDTGAGAWPRGELANQELITRVWLNSDGKKVETQLTPAEFADVKKKEAKSGLTNPWASPLELLPWAFREPIDRELITMTSTQMQDVYRRKASGWKMPPVLGPAD